jgi:hypothetical protein
MTPSASRLRAAVLALRWDAAAALLTVPLLVPVAAPGWFVGHDDLQPIRLFELDVMIRDGQFPVRWFPDVSGGYGSPHPQFYAPLFYLIAELFFLAGAPLTLSLKAALAFILAATSISMFRLGRALLGEAAGLVAAAGYTYSPYHLVDLYVRTAFSELTAFVFLPASILAFLKLAREPSPARAAAAGAALAGLLLSHTLTLMIGPPVVLGYVLFLTLRVDRPARHLAAAAGAALLGAAMAAFFLIPLAAERDAVETRHYVTAYFDYAKHFVRPDQLVFSRWGFGFSMPGVPDGMSFRLGLLQVAGSLLALGTWRRLRRSLPEAAAHAFFAAAVSAAGAAMTLDASAPVWSSLPPLKFVQFPWRFLMLPSFGMALLCGAAAAGLASGAPAGRRRRWELAAGGSACAVIAAASLGMIGFEARAPLEKIRYRMDAGQPSAGAASGTPGRRGFTREFLRDQLLKWIDHVPKGGFPVPTEADLLRPRIEVLSGSAEAAAIEERPASLTFRVRAAGAAAVRINVHRFPGWTVLLDGRPAQEGPPAPGRPVLTAIVPPGDHVVSAVFRRTAPRWAGDLLSLAGVAAACALGARPHRARR